MLNKAKNLKIRRIKNVRFGTVWYLVRKQFERITVYEYENKF